MANYNRPPWEVSDEPPVVDPTAPAPGYVYPWVAQPAADQQIPPSEVPPEATPELSPEAQAARDRLLNDDYPDEQVPPEGPPWSADMYGPPAPGQAVSPDRVAPPVVPPFAPEAAPPAPVQAAPVQAAPGVPEAYGPPWEASRPAYDKRTQVEVNTDRALGIDEDQDLAARETELKANAAKSINERMVKDIQQNQEDTKTDRQKRMEREQRWQIEYDQLYEENDSLMKENIDPDHWMNTRSGGQKFMSVLGAALGGWLGVRNGTNKNMFMDFIEQEIQTDIDSQKATLANKREVSGQKLNALGMLRAKYGDESEAEAQYTAMKYNQAANLTAAYANSFQSDETRLQGEQRARDLRGRAAGILAEAAANRVKAQDEHEKTQAEIAKLEAETAQTEKKTAGLGAKKAKVSPYMPVDTNGDGRIDNADLSDDQRTRVIRLPNGQPMRDPETGALILANAPADATVYRKSIVAWQTAREAIKEYKRLRTSYGREPGGAGGWTEGAKKMNAARQRAQRAIVVLDDLGALTGSDYGSLAKGLPDVPGKTSELTGFNEVWDAPLLEQLDEKMDGDMRQLGYSGSFSGDSDALVTHKPGAIAELSPEQKEEKSHAAAKSEADKRAEKIVEEQAQSGDYLYVQIKNPKTKTQRTLKVPNNDETRAKLKAKEWTLSTPEQIDNHVKN